jgi:hypothetical protein
LQFRFLDARPAVIGPAHPFEFGEALGRALLGRWVHVVHGTFLLDEAWAIDEVITKRHGVRKKQS